MSGFLDERVTEYLGSLYRPLDDEMAEFRALNEADNVPLILRETESLLSLLLELTRPRRILEIGTAYGYSAVYFARKNPDARITTIDRSEFMIGRARENFSKYAEGSRIEFLEGDATEILDELIHSHEASGGMDPYDFIFIDAGKSHYRDFFDRACRIASPGALIVCDNILMHGWMVDRSYEGAKRHRTNVKYMRQFIDYITNREDLTVSLISGGDGLAIIRLHE